MTQLSAITAPQHINRRIERRNPTEGKSKAGGIRKEVIWRDREQMEVDTYRYCNWQEQNNELERERARKRNKETET